MEFVKPYLARTVQLLEHVVLQFTHQLSKWKVKGVK